MEAASTQATLVRDAHVALADAARRRREASVAEVALMVWLAKTYRVDEERLLLAGTERYLRFGADGTPVVGEFLLAELGPLLGCPVEVARTRLIESLDLVYRHPELWEAVQHHALEVWQARIITWATSRAQLSQAAAGWVDHQAACALRHGWPVSRVLHDLDGWVLRADPALAAERAELKARDRHVTLSRIEDHHVGLSGRLDAAGGLALDAALDRTADALAAAGHVGDHRSLRASALGHLAQAALGEVPLPMLDADCVGPADPPGPAIDGPAQNPRRVVLTVHLRPGSGGPDRADASGAGSFDPFAVATIDGWGDVLTERLGAIFAGCPVTIRPVIDLTGLAAVDGYEVPDRMREAVCARNPVEVFSFGARASRSCDLDHTTPYQPGVPGQTRPENLGPLSRFTHRAKTFTDWRVVQPEPGVFDWTSPIGFRYRVTPQGTTMTGWPEGVPAYLGGELDDPLGVRRADLAGRIRIAGLDEGSGRPCDPPWDEDRDDPDPPLEGWVSPSDAWAFLRRRVQQLALDLR